MNIRVEKRENPYLQVDKTPINDIDLSPQALGVLFYILSKPNNWKAHKNEVVKRFCSAKHIKVTSNAIDNCFIELRKAGYIKIVPTRGTNGQVNGSEYVFSETPNKPTEMAISTDVGQSTEMPRCSEVGKSSTVGNLRGYSKESFSLIKNNKKEKENESTPAKNSKTETSKQGIKTLDVQTIQKTNTTVPASCSNDTKYRLIESREELIKVTEGIIRENAEGLKMDYERKGFKIQNARDYAIEFATQFFKDAEKCGLSDAKIKDRLCGWSYIFGKVNAEIATATKADNLNLPFAERQAKEAAAVQQAKPTNKNLSSFEQAMAERKRILFEESQK